MMDNKKMNSKDKNFGYLENSQKSTGQPPIQSTTSIDELKKKFANGELPTQDDFSAIFDSYFHKDIKIPEEDIDGLINDLNSKEDKTDADKRFNDLNTAVNDLKNSKEDKTDAEAKFKDLDNRKEDKADADKRFGDLNTAVEDLKKNKEDKTEAEAKFKDLDDKKEDKTNADKRFGDLNTAVEDLKKNKEDKTEADQKFGDLNTAVKNLQDSKEEKADMVNYLQINPAGLQDNDIVIREGGKWIRKQASEVSTIKPLTLQENGETIGTFDGRTETTINIASDVRLLPSAVSGIEYINIDTLKKEIDFGSDPILLINNKMYDLIANQQDKTKYRNVSIVVKPSNAIKIYFDKINFLFFAASYIDAKIYPNTVLVGAIRFVDDKIMADLPCQYTVNGVLTAYAPILAPNVTNANINFGVTSSKEIDIKTFIKIYQNSESGSVIAKGGFVYANNHILNTDYGKVNLASTTSLIAGYSENLGIQTLIQCGANNPISGGLKNELIMYDSRSEGYLSGWTRMLNDHNFNEYAPKNDGTGATGTWNININGNSAGSNFLNGYYNGGGKETPEYFKYFGLRAQMLMLPGGWSDVIYVNGYNSSGGTGSDVAFVNAIGFNKQGGTNHSDVYHTTAAHGSNAWGTWHKFIDRDCKLNCVRTKKNKKFNFVNTV